MIFDRSTAAPIHIGKNNSLIPAEALYSVVEVKSILTEEELSKCVAAAKKIRALTPFKRKFKASHNGGERIDELVRCPYYIFAYTSNISIGGWAEKEFERLLSVLDEQGGSSDLVDRILVLDRGIICPNDRTVSLVDNSSSLFLDFYVHLINFLTRERRRRPVIDWMIYASRGKWQKIKPGS